MQRSIPPIDEVIPAKYRERIDLIVNWLGAAANVARPEHSFITLS